MAAELLLVNPRRRGRKRRKARASTSRRRRRISVLNRNPIRRKRRRMSARQRMFFGGGKRRRKSSRAVTVMNTNPKRRRSGRRKYSIFRRNPSPLSNPTGYAENMIVPAASGAVGGIALDYLFTNVTALANLSPMVQNVAKLVGAALLGYGVAQVAGQKTGQAVAAGAITITVYDIATQWMAGQGMGYGYAGAGGQGGQGGYGNGMGRYVRMNGIRPSPMRRRVGRLKGWMSPARTGNLGRFVPAH